MGSWRNSICFWIICKGWENQSRGSVFNNGWLSWVNHAPLPQSYEADLKFIRSMLQTKGKKTHLIKIFRGWDQIQVIFTYCIKAFSDILKVPQGTFLSYFILYYTIHILDLTSRHHPCVREKDVCKIKTNTKCKIWNWFRGSVTFRQTFDYRIGKSITYTNIMSNKVKLYTDQ